MEHFYIKDETTGRSLWITKQYSDHPPYKATCTILLDEMVFREEVRENSLPKLVRDWMKMVKKLNTPIKEEIEYMELFEYEGEPTEEEIKQRLEFWKHWSPNGYKDNHLRIHLTCPCCESNEDTDWVRDEYHVCYNCLISFTLEDSVPVVTKEEYEQMEADNEYYE